jgi:hypothetical protein
MVGTNVVNRHTNNSATGSQLAIEPRRGNQEAVHAA